MNDIISIVIITYGRKYDEIKRSIKSAMNQTYKNKEIILVDDNGIGSEIQKNIEKNIRNDNVKYIKHKKNKGAQEARNTGIKNSSGCYIAFLDDDDEWYSNKLEEQKKHMKNGVGLVYSMGKIVYEETGEILDYVTTKYFNNNATFKDLLYGDCIGTTTQALIKKDVFKDVGYFDLLQPARQDYEMWIRISKKYKCVGVTKPLFKHYIHKNEQISKDNKKAISGLLNIYVKYKKDYKKNNIASWHICYLIGNRYIKDRKLLLFIHYHLKALYYLFKSLIFNYKDIEYYVLKRKTN